MTRKKLPAMSPSETEILRLLWSLSSGTVQDVCDRLPPGREIAYATVQTLLRRLEKKGYVTHQAKGKAHVFSPTARRENVIRRSVTDFVDKLFGGDPVPLMLHLVDETHLSHDDYERLKKIIDQAGRQDKREPKQG
ncbi:MAG: BlaI/MecI/CopY family transcriptional regulator [Phycisphaerae bacterium]|nr:BlaI/MecI/CopY family transcriptional regulator [Phycisphaerae bacterium]